MAVRFLPRSTERALEARARAGAGLRWVMQANRTPVPMAVLSRPERRVGP